MIDNLEDVLRETLAEHADRAPRGPAVAERILADIERPGAVTSIRSSRWTGWGLPLIAAASVVVVVGALVATARLDHDRPASSQTTTVNSLAPSPTPTSTTAPSNGPTPTAAPAVIGPPGGPVPAAFRVGDLTFAGNEVWALGSATCLSGPGRCTALLRSVDNGVTWTGIPSPSTAEVVGGTGDCAANCVSQVRFASALVGWVYGPARLYATIDGGAHWTEQTGGAWAIEAADGTALRLSDPCGCSPGVTPTVSIATVGSTSWRPVLSPGSDLETAMQRSGPVAVVTLSGNPAGGSENAKTSYWISDDGGVTWTAKPEICPQNPAVHEVDGSVTGMGADHSIAIVCTPRAADSVQFGLVSADGGKSWTQVHLPAGGVSAFEPASAGVLLAVSGDQLLRTTDGGGSWTPVASGAVDQSGAGFLGFQTPAEGRWVTDGGSRIWTTSDAGATWTAHAFS